MEKVCPVCGNAFEAKKSNHVCCCRRCRDRYTRMHKVRNCIICGKEFTSPDNTQFCSKECKHQYKLDSLTYKKKCEYCGKEYERFSFSKFCSLKCKGAVTRANHRETSICENCGKEYEKSEYIKRSYEKENKEYHSFCSHACCIEFLYKTHRLTAKYSKPHKEINQLLESMRIDYTNEVTNGKYTLDISLNENQAIEIMGGYWHGDVRRFPTEKLHDRQKSGIEKDKRRQKYFEEKEIDILYLWEIDVDKNLDLCKILINNFINHKLPSYSHSSSYDLKDWELVPVNNVEQYIQTA